MFKFLLIVAIVVYVLRKKGIIKRKEVHIELPTSFDGCTDNYNFVIDYYRTYKALEKEESLRRKANSNQRKGSNSAFDMDLAIMHEFSNKKGELNKWYEKAVEYHVDAFKKLFDNVNDKTLCRDMCSAKLDEVSKVLSKINGSTYHDKLKEALEDACNEVKKKVEIATCEHKYEPVFSPYYKDDLFQEVTVDGCELLRCSKCGNNIVGKKITEPFSCGDVGEEICTDILYTYNDTMLEAGKYTVTFSPHYIIANCRAPKLKIEKGDQFILLYCDDYKIEKNNDYPLGLNIKAYVDFVDESGDILEGESLCVAPLDNLKSKADIDKEIDERFGLITAHTTDSEIRERVYAESNLRRESNLILLRVPQTASMLNLFVYVDDEDIVTDDYNNEE